IDASTDVENTEGYLELTRLKMLAEQYHAAHGAFPALSQSLTPSTACCAFAGGRCPADPAAWDLPAWNAYGFAIVSAHDFQYAVTASANGAAMIANARGDLDCDNFTIDYM